MNAAAEPVPGDFVLAHRHHLIARLITFAQRWRFRGPDARYAHWSHAAVVDEGAHVIEAEIDGIVRSLISRYHAGEYRVVRLDGMLDASGRERVVGYACSRLGQGFGFLDMLGASIYLLTGVPVHLVRRRHEICSSLVVRSLQEGGLLGELDPALTLPADLAKRFDAA